MTSLMSVAEAVGRGEEVNTPLEDGVPLVSQADSSKAKRAKEHTGECPGPSCSSLREGPTAVHLIGSPLVLSAPSLLRASYKAVSSGEGTSSHVSQSGRGEAPGCLYGSGLCALGVCCGEERSE